MNRRQGTGDRKREMVGGQGASERATGDWRLAIGNDRLLKLAHGNCHAPIFRVIRHSLSVSVHLRARDELAVGTPARLRRVLANFLTNVLRAEFRHRNSGIVMRSPAHRGVSGRQHHPHADMWIGPLLSCRQCSTRERSDSRAVGLTPRPGNPASRNPESPR